MVIAVDIYSFFYAAIPSEGVLALEDLHTIVREVWLPRYDAELETERASRRKGRPKSTREQKIEELKLREAEEYRTGLGAFHCKHTLRISQFTPFIEVVDLTEPTNVGLFRKWDQKESAYTQQLRFIRISSAQPDLYTVSRYGHHPTLPKAPKPAPPAATEPQPTGDVAMDEDEVPLLLDPSRFSSTIMGMDEIPS